MSSSFASHSVLSTRIAAWRRIEVQERLDLLLEPARPAGHDVLGVQIVPASKDNPFARAHGLVDRFVVMHSGNVGLSQGVDRLLDVAERLRDLPDVVIAIVGDGAQKPALINAAEARKLTNVRFFPYQPKSALIDSFATADAFLVSLKRGLSGFIVPSKLYGILAAGRPFIAAVEDDSEAADIAREYDCGIVVPPGSVEGIEPAIRELHERSGRARAMGDRARKAGLLFDRRRAVSSYEHVFPGADEWTPSHGVICRCPWNGRPAVVIVRRIPVAKRALDVALSGFGLLASAPVWALLAAAIKLEDGGPVFYLAAACRRGRADVRGVQVPVDDSERRSRHSARCRRRRATRG